jgi:hypothetical protein
MKPLMILPTALFLCFSGVPLSGQNTSATITASSGWGEIVLKKSKYGVEKALGPGELTPIVGSGYYLDYPAKGLRIFFTAGDNLVQSIIFYNKQRGFERFATFRGATPDGLDWQSSADQVIGAFGKPAKDVSGKNSDCAWRRLVFKGIDFIYEDGRMVRIGIAPEDLPAPNNKQNLKKSHTRF